MQTLKQAIHLVQTHKNKDLVLAAGVLHGKPTGSWAETQQAMQQMIDALPPPNVREYTVQDWIKAMYRENPNTCRWESKY